MSVCGGSLSISASVFCVYSCLGLSVEWVRVFVSVCVGVCVFLLDSDKIFVFF